MTILGMAWRVGNESTSPHNNVNFSGSKATFGLGFSAASFLAPGRVLAVGETIGVPLFFNASTAGSYSISVKIWLDGGVDEVLISASAGIPAIASIAVSKEGGWDNRVLVALDFGEVLAGTTVTKQLRICNVGGSVLTITKSKPPVSPQLTAANPCGEFLEGQNIAIGSCAYATVAVYAGTVQQNHAAQHINLTWVLNTDGQDALNASQEFGVREINTSVTITTKQVATYKRRSIPELNRLPTLTTNAKTYAFLLATRLLELSITRNAGVETQ
ncbi:hypothetical protein B0H67DRAFT_30427 [Lasiosphaeris hirsuta]|uniref:Abnormal spindle-like microcephaly-associated protein ASH domain-containing protein n=1 Tax=Lasiosphaeris hirsuta TaxID=260670 RepID=A0AA40E811_9PEZI|nr:hypothetical protein B0H67DRAFT_30427 [Lasiosphaeris hirsuta]